MVRNVGARAALTVRLPARMVLWTSNFFLLPKLCLWTPWVPFILSGPSPRTLLNCHVCYSRINFQQM